jgi:integrase-like protein
MKRKQKWITFRGNQRQAEKKLAELVNAHNNNELVEPSKMTVREWLLEWVEKAIKPPKTPGHLRGIQAHHRPEANPAVGAMRLQQLKALDIERYYADVKGLSETTLTLLKAHKKARAELKMKNRVAYHDLGLVFAREWADLYGREASLGLPLQSNNIGQREFARLIKTADVRPITLHGLRHTSATLLLKAGVPPHVVQRRLGHANIGITLDITPACCRQWERPQRSNSGRSCTANRLTKKLTDYVALAGTRQQSRQKGDDRKPVNTGRIGQGSTRQY